MNVELIDSRLSGNAWKVRLLLRALKQPFSRVTLDLTDQETKSKIAGSTNPFNRIPVLRLADGRSVYESSAILIHLARGTEYLPQDGSDYDEVMAWLFFEQADLMHFVSSPRFYKITGQAEHKSQEIELYKSIAASGLTTLNSVLENRDWIANYGLSIADFAHFPYLRLAHEGGIELGSYAAIYRWLQRFQSHEWFEELLVDD